MKKLLMVGDSHAGVWGGWDKIKIPNFSITMLAKPSQLMFSWSRDKIQCLTEVKQHEYVCFCHGEIDMRNHVHKYIPDWEQNIDTLVDMYIKNIKTNVTGIDVKIFIHNVNPHLYNEIPLRSVPREGSAEDIKKYTLYINKKLEERCIENGFIFFDTYDKYCNEDGFLDPKYSDGICHVSDPIHNENWLKEFLEKEEYEI